MANTIRIKRRAAGGVLGAPSGLANAELAYNEGDNILYYGFGTGGTGGTATQAIPIAGSGAYLNKNNNLSDLNNTQTSRNNLAGGTVTSGLFMRGNGTNVLMGSILASDIPTLNQNTTGSAGSVTSSLTINNGGAGDNSGSTFNGSSAKTISYNSIGSPSAGGANATGTWNISVTGNAGTVTNGVYTTGDQSISGVKTFKQDVYLDSVVQFQGTGIGGNSLYFDYDSGGSVGLKTEIHGQNSLGAWKNKTLTIENGTVGNITLEAHFGKINLWGPSGVNMDAGASSSSGTNFATFVDYSSAIVDGVSYGNGIIKTRTAAQVKSDIGLGNVENLALSGVTFTAGSGLAGGGTLAANRTFNIGQGDGISVSDNAIAVNNTVVRTTENQSVGGVKTFNSKPVFNSGILVGGSSRFTIGAESAFDFSIDRGNVDPGFFGDVLKFDVDNDNGNGHSTTLKTSGPTQNIIVRLPDSSGVLARLQDITTANITGTLAVNKGGTGATTLTSNNILVGNGTSAISAPYTVETTLTGGASAIPRADAVKTYVDNLLSANDAMVFKGTIGTGGTVTALPTTYSAGHAYRVITAGTYAGKVCEIGDLLIAIVDRSGSSNTNDDWTAIQTNLDGAVIGPASGTDNALAVYNGVTGKLIKNSSFVPTTVGGNLINLTNPGAIRFVRINTDNSVSSLSDTDFRTAIGAGTSSTVGTVTSVGGTGSSAGLTLTGTVTTAGSLTLGGTLSTPVSTINDSTTVGQNLVKLTNPSAIRFVRINADNSVSSLSNTDFRTAIGAGTSSTVGTVTTISAGSGMNYSPITSTGSVVLGTPSSITLSSTNNVTATSHTHAFAPGGTTSQYIRGDGAAISGAALTKTDDTNVTLTIGGSPTNALLSATSLTLGWTGNLAVNRGGTGQTSYTNGQLLIGDTTGNTLTKATLTEGTGIDITNGNGSITITHEDTSTLTGAQGSNGIASISVDGLGHVTAVTSATYLTAGTVCAAIVDCTLDGGSF